VCWQEKSKQKGSAEMAEIITLKAEQKSVKLYLGKAGKSEAEIVTYCKDVVCPWLENAQNHANNTPVNLADFWTAKGGNTLMLVAALDNDGTDWSKIPNVDQFFEVSYPTGVNLLHIEPQPDLKIS
jgi:hypothetical protein